MTRLLLIRHGQTDYTLQNRYCGFNNPPLNDKGIWQSEKLAARLKETKIEKIYSSDLLRALQTAKIISGDSPVEQSSDLREMSFGLFEGLKYEQIMDKYPELYRKWIDNPRKGKTPDGEGLKDLSRRVEKKISEIISRNEGGTIAVVTHSGPIRIVLCKALKFGLKKFWRIDQQLCALNIIDYDQQASPTVVKMNDTSHLSVMEEAPL